MAGVYLRASLDLPKYKGGSSFPSFLIKSGVFILSFRLLGNRPLGIKLFAFPLLYCANISPTCIMPVFLSTASFLAVLNKLSEIAQSSIVFLFSYHSGEVSIKFWIAAYLGDFFCSSVALSYQLNWSFKCFLNISTLYTLLIKSIYSLLYSPLSFIQNGLS